MNTQFFWDRQFKFSEVIPGFAEALVRMSDDSAAFAKDRVFDRIAYGDHARQWVEWCAGSGPQNVVPVIIHGGYWRALEAERHRFMMDAFLRHGAAVANVEYRLMPDVRLADVVADVTEALRALSGQFPNSKLLLVGHSAGAHLALTAMQDQALVQRTAGLIALSGVYDLGPVAHSFLQAELQLTSDEIAAFTLSPSSDRPPVLFVNGSAETHEFLRGAAVMAQTANANWHIIENADHMSLTYAACERSDALVSALFELERST